MTTSALPPHSLSNTIQAAANVQLYDEGNGIFGELISPQAVLSSLALEENVGDVSQSVITPLQSRLYAGGEIVLEFDNTCVCHKVRIRWINEHGHTPATHVWTVDPDSTFVQCSRPGHLFLLSILVGTQEQALAAYRPFRTLPSGSPHCILIQQEEGLTDCFLLELLLSSAQDSLMVAASALDHALGFSDRKTVPMLHTIVTNVIKHPGEEKYRKLRMSNRAIQNHIVSAWGALHLLHVLGFRETKVAVETTVDSQDKDMEEFLILWHAPGDAQLDVFKLAKEILEILMTRADPQFVAELAEPPPWHTPLVTSGGALSSHWNTRGTHFMTPDERWARTERNRRGGRRPRRPDPGNAPSSRGTWGR